MTGCWDTASVGLVPLKRFAEIRLGKMLQPAPESLSDSETPYLRAGLLGQLASTDELPTMWASSWDASRYSVREGDLVVAEGGDVGRTAFVPSLPENTIIQNSLHRLRSLPSGDLRYLRYSLDAVYGSGWLDVLCNKATFGHLTSEKLGSLEVPAVPLATQRLVADFLDAETARIDALIEKKQQMIELVNERWQTYVRDRLARLAPILPLKRRWRVTDCKHRTPTYVDDGFPVVSPGDVVPGRLDLSVCHRFVDETDLADLTEGRKPKRGDIIYSRNASAGIAALVDTDAPFCMGQDVCLITSLDQDQRFLMYALNSIGMDQLEPLKIGSTITRINVDQIGELEIPAPDPETQRGAANELDAKRSIVGASTARLSQQIRLLQERRQALITAAVTGELDLAEAA